MDVREEFTTFDTIGINAAIREACGHSLRDLTTYQVRFEHVSGTCTLSMRIDPDSLANRLGTALAAQELICYPSCCPCPSAARSIRTLIKVALAHSSKPQAQFRLQI